jgi:hypothetical protein
VGFGELASNKANARRQGLLQAETRARNACLTARRG